MAIPLASPHDLALENGSSLAQNKISLIKQAGYQNLTETEHMATSFQDILTELEKSSESMAHQGKLFEKLMRQFFRKVGPWSHHFEAVELWEDSVYRDGPDTGIDLVATTKGEGEIWAIQCKFYCSEYTLQKRDIDSFFTASGKRPFTHRLIVTTTCLWSSHAEKALQNQRTSCRRLDAETLSSYRIDWGTLDVPRLELVPSNRQALDHQKEAIEKILEGFQDLDADRGKLIMACGTGKTFTALRLTEEYLPRGGMVLYLVPSIALLSQTLREWGNEKSSPQGHFAVCSDAKVGKDDEDMRLEDLGYPASTDAEDIVRQIKSTEIPLKVIFSTYQSVEVLKEAQRAHCLPAFDLVICDEAHRTTSHQKKGLRESYFGLVHKNEHIQASKRLYMTATPKVYTAFAKDSAKNKDVEISSMDDTGIYGEEFYRLDFSQAIERDLLTDYKVVVPCIPEKFFKGDVQRMFARGGELPTDDTAKIIACYMALSKKGEWGAEGEDPFSEDPSAMRRAVAFCKDIKASKAFIEHFKSTIGEVRKEDIKGLRDAELDCQLDHTDGRQSALERNKKLAWLKGSLQKAPRACRVLSNARCLGEGVDVPTLDAIIFVNPRKSRVNIVQAVGRVMRKSKGKKYGYIILPIFIPAETDEAKVLDRHRHYDAIWQVLDALRSHDNRFDALINKLEFTKGTQKELIIGTPTSEGESSEDTEPYLPLPQEIKDSIRSKIVEKCGNRRYWSLWAEDTGRIARTVEEHIRQVFKSDAEMQETCRDFLTGLRRVLNPNITEEEACEMLAQHFVTMPIFNALFKNEDFAHQNPVSKAMEGLLVLLKERGLEKEVKDLKGFYRQCHDRLKGIENEAGRQKIIMELYNNFFIKAFSKAKDRLGIVYTPVELVDFILQSAQDVLKQEFKRSLSSEAVHILDPFTGMGTFISRLINSEELIGHKHLKRKFQKELHANELVLLAYYIATVNIETSYHRRLREAKDSCPYTPFEGAVFTDTFQMTEGTGQQTDRLRDTTTGKAWKIPGFEENSERATRQNQLPIQVIVGNPPYSAGQRSENDNSQNLKYPQLDARIRKTYAEQSTAISKKVYDSYIRAVRWASDRLGKQGGVIAYVTNGSFINGKNTDGLRCCLMEEFDAIYCLNLRGNALTKGEARRKEKGNVFGEGTRATIAITVLVKHREGSPLARSRARLYYHDIGDYLSRKEKIDQLQGFKSSIHVPWKKIEPDSYGNWIGQFNATFQSWLPLGDKANKQKRAERVPAVFEAYSPGVKTNRDAWTYHFSKEELACNMEGMIGVYNQQREAFQQSGQGTTPEDFIDTDEGHINWDVKLKEALKRNEAGHFEAAKITLSHYRPFCKKWLYACKQFNARPGRHKTFFPQGKANNRAICVSQGSGSFSTLMVDCPPNFDSIGNTQVFPLYRYEGGGDLLGGDEKVDNLADTTLRQFQAHYEDEDISKWDIFHYVYGLLHAPSYKELYKADLQKGLPRVPFHEDFQAFSQCGEKLACLHLRYEDLEPCPDIKEAWRKTRPQDNREAFRVNKMAFTGKKKDPNYLSELIWNTHLTLKDIPQGAWHYTLNGKAALRWVMDCYSVETDKNSHITHDPNLYSENPRYILDLFKRVATLSLKTQAIIQSLPKLRA